MPLSPDAPGFGKSMSDIDWATLTSNRQYYPSPVNWEDELLYFLLIDRFSDNKESGGYSDNNGASPPANRTTPLFQLSDAQNTFRDQWYDNGKKWCGGTLNGIRDKLGYLKRMGITAVWISPPFKQTQNSNSYHGYGIQHFLDIEPRYGTKQDLKDLVQEAHRLGIRVILDIICNHAGNVFAYEGANHYRDSGQWPVRGYRLHENDPGALPFQELDPNTHPNAWPNGAVWPREFQHPSNWTRKGEIGGWDNYPEYIEGDFYSLKDIYLGQGDAGWQAWQLMERIRDFRKHLSLRYLADVYKFWVAYADIDGYRLDTVKHMEPGAVRYFTNVIHDFAQSIGKENFLIVGEILGGRSHAVNIVDWTGLDAGLGIDDIQDKLEFLAKGRSNPEYFDLFNNSLVDGKATHQWFGRRVVTMFDDHDQVNRKYKFRYCGEGGSAAYDSLRGALALNLLTLGIPCIYYGSEQAFNGADDRGPDGPHDFSDPFLRECMFGGSFGSFQSTGRHFFNEQHQIYLFIAALARLKRQHMALRRGRQYLREVSASGNADDFYLPEMIGGQLRWVIAWSRIFDTAEMVCAINTDLQQPITIFITTDKEFTPPGTPLHYVYSTDTNQVGAGVTAMPAQNRSVIRVTVPAGGVIVLSNR